MRNMGKTESLIINQDISSIHKHLGSFTGFWGKKLSCLIFFQLECILVFNHLLNSLCVSLNCAPEPTLGDSLV
jgi:hypothetical protein